MTPAGTTPVAEARDLQQVYRIGRGLLREPARLHAVGGVSFTLQPGRTLAVVGESGCGKSTLARMVSLVELPTGGSLRLGGTDAAQATPEQRKALRRSVQMVFQNPYASLNPRKKIGAILEAPLAINTALSPPEREQRARAIAMRWRWPPENMCG